VTKADTTITLTSKPNPSKRSQRVTFTAKVTPSAATGTVQFFDGAISLGATTLSGGSATLVTTGLAVGMHSITAQYSGDNNYNSSTSAILIQTVTRK
jgi:hypothetical protein